MINALLILRIYSFFSYVNIYKLVIDFDRVRLFINIEQLNMIRLLPSIFDSKTCSTDLSVYGHHAI